MTNYFTMPGYSEIALTILRAAIYVVTGYIIARLTSSAVLRFFKKRRWLKYDLLLHKIIFYIIFILFFISALRELGFDLKILLGATGLLTIAIGLASQTAASNFISGLFLLGEPFFRIGDTISVNDITGEILAIDIFSVKLKQADNTLARIPNEMLLKTQVINLTHFSTDLLKDKDNANAKSNDNLS